MNALTAVQSINPLGPARDVAGPILIKVELLGDLCVLHFRGRLHASSHSDYLDSKMEEIRTLASTKLLANFADVTSLDCCGLSFIIRLFKISGGRLVAVNSVSSQAVSVPVIVRDDAGAQIATDTLNLAPNGHTQFTLVTDKYPGTANIRGTIEFDRPANGQIGALGIRIPAGVVHTYTTLPPLAK